MIFVDLRSHPGYLSVSERIFGFGIELIKKSGLEVGCVTEKVPCTSVFVKLRIGVDSSLVGVKG